MRDRGGELVGEGGQVHGHEAAIAGADVAHALGIDERVRGQESPGAVDDVVGGVLAPGVDVQGRGFLAVADGAPWLQHIDDIAIGSPEVERIAAGELAVHRCRAAVVIDDQWIALVRIEIGRQVVAAVDLITVAVVEAPVADLAQAGLAIVGLRAVEQYLVAVAGQVDDMHALRPVGIGAVHGQGRRGATGGNKAFQNVDAGVDALKVPVGDMEAVEQGAVALGNRQQQVAAVQAFQAADRRHESAAHAGSVLAVGAEQIKLAVIVVGGGLVGQRVAITRAQVGAGQQPVAIVCEARAVDLAQAGDVAAAAIGQ